MRSFLLALPFVALVVQAGDGPTQSPHRRGPVGLVGWTLEWKIPDHGDERFAFTLIIARKGHVVRRIDGEPLVSTWMFLPDGKRVAYEAGPLHFGMRCVLAEIATGKELASYDCYHKLPADGPDWVKDLEKQGEPAK